MPLQTGSWKINANGVLGTLAINSVDTQGNVQGALALAGLAIGPIAGFWDELSAKLTFIAQAGGVNTYTGYLSADQFRMPGISGGTVWTLTGYYESLGGSADRFAFGWYAQLGQS